MSDRKGGQILNVLMEVFISVKPLDFTLENLEALTIN